MELIQPLVDILKCIWEPIHKRITYSKNLRKNLKKLNEDVAELCCMREDLKNKIDRLKQQKVPTELCMDWLRRVDNVEIETTQIEEEYNADKRCLKGLFPNIHARVMLGERVLEMIGSVEDLKKKKSSGTNEADFLADPGPEQVQPIPIPRLVELSSTDGNSRNVLTQISKKEITKLGIWGLGGVGKTTILKLLNNNPEIREMFDVVIWVTVSNSWDYKKLQVEVAQRLSIHINEVDSEDSFARRLHGQLAGKKYMLLMDDLWDMVDLSRVGFPEPDQNNGCKVVLTTRELKVCRSMETDDNIPVNTLSEEESWKIFYGKVGEVSNSSTIKPLAKAVMRECGGLPLALNVVGAVLRDEGNDRVWRSFLRELQTPGTSNFKDMETVFKPLKVSYDKLKDENTKKCFLFCGLFPEDTEIKKSILICYWQAEGLLLRDGTLVDSKDKGQAILRELIDASLLERCEREGFVKLHDVIRDLVLKITSAEGEGGTEYKQLVRAGRCKEAIPEAKEWENASRISFVENQDLTNLPDMPKCRKLSSLLLQYNYRLEKIPVAFFNCMSSVRVLDLSETTIEFLPASISNLVCLRALILKECNFLNELPPEIGELEELEVLLAVATAVRCMPDEIWKLTKLKYIHISSNTGELNINKMVLSGWISKLTRLEIFRCNTNICKTLADEAIEVITKHLCTLDLVSSVEFNFRNLENLQYFLNNCKSWINQSLRKFRIYVAKQDFDSAEISSKYLVYETREDEGNTFPCAIIEVLKYAENLKFFGDKSRRKFSVLDMRNMDGLKQLNVNTCSGLEIFVHADEEESNYSVFSKLEILKLLELQSLGSIWPEGNNYLNSNSFTNLETLLIVRCNKLKKLFPRGWIQQLRNLKYLTIFHCENFEEMISDEDVKEIEVGALPKLQTISFDEMPEFVSFFRGGEHLCWPSLEHIWISNCPKLKKLPFGLNNAVNLNSISCYKDEWEQMEWENDAVRDRLSLLTMLLLR